MKKIITSRIFVFALGAILFSGITGVLAYNYMASQIGYTPANTSWKVSTVDEALNSLSTDAKVALKKFCKLKSGTALTVGSMYECDPGDGTKRNFYVLTVRDEEVDLIMETNLSDTVGTARTMTWNDAMKYFRTGAGTSIKTSWKNVLSIDLPKAQAIVDAVGRTDWIASDSGATWWCFGSKAQDSQSSPYCTNASQNNYAWLFNHTIGCKSAGCTDDSGATAYGYWTRDLISNTAGAWNVYWPGLLGNHEVSHSTDYGVRPVITVLKSNLYTSN